MFVDASHDAALLSRSKRLALEAIDAVVKALLDQVGIHLRLASATARKHDNAFQRAVTWGLRTFMNSFICFFSMRFCSSRCSAEVRLDGRQQSHGKDNGRRTSPLWYLVARNGGRYGNAADVDRAPGEW